MLLIPGAHVGLGAPFSGSVEEEAGQVEQLAAVFQPVDDGALEEGFTRSTGQVWVLLPNRKFPQECRAASMWKEIEFALEADDIALGGQNLL